MNETTTMTTMSLQSGCNNIYFNKNLKYGVIDKQKRNKPGRPKGLAGPELPLDWWNPCGKLTL